MSDAKSGPGTVTLTGSEEVVLAKTNEYEREVDGVNVKFAEYTGKIGKNGTYSITLSDNAGNKSVKSFNVKKISTKQFRLLRLFTAPRNTPRAP
ncbi:MAG: hypothetical protein L6V93_22945 [Clostridiales bacterium]|nr:MAG: hypothetical protein L6V93_22945 [Clostridiales bacterium]